MSKASFMGFLSLFSLWSSSPPFSQVTVQHSFVFCSRQIMAYRDKENYILILPTNNKQMKKTCSDVPCLQREWGMNSRLFIKMNSQHPLFSCVCKLNQSDCRRHIITTFILIVKITLIPFCMTSDGITVFYSISRIPILI